MGRGVTRMGTFLTTKLWSLATDLGVFRLGVLDRSAQYHHDLL